MKFSTNKKRILSFIVSSLLLFCCLSCNNNVKETANSDESSNQIDNSSMDENSSEENDNSSTDENSNSSDETNTGIDVNDNPGDGGYTWTPGEH